MINPNNLCPGCMNEKLADGKCPLCGYNPDEPANPSFLAPGTMLDGRYVIGKVIDSNGEGVTYLGYDTVTSSTVNVREFFPVGLCERDPFDGSVAMTPGGEFNYNDTLMKFIELSKTLFRLNELPALFDVLDVREANNTAYRITKSVPGISLREFLMRNGGMLKWDQARSLFAPLISSISALHKAGVVHRGISPDTLIVGKDGKIRINGFLIPEARTARSPLTSQMFPGFAAVEQYGGAGNQGPWTDVYAFAATIYRTLVGNPPPEATARVENDNMTIPAHVAKETPKPVLETLANALQVMPEDRTQSIDEMRKGLAVSSAQVAAAVVPVAGRSVNDNGVGHSGKNKKKKPKGAGGLYGIVACIVTVFVLALIVFFVLGTMGLLGGEDAATSSSRPSAASVASGNNSSVASKTDVDFSEKYVLPDITENFKFSEIEIGSEVIDTNKVTIVISHKEYSDDVKEGYIISQNPAPGTQVSVGDTKPTVEVVVSLGPRNIKIDELVNDLGLIGRDSESARIALLERGFRNVVIDNSIQDETMPTGAVVRIYPGTGSTVTTDSKIILFANTYYTKEEDSSGVTSTTTP